MVHGIKGLPEVEVADLNVLTVIQPTGGLVEEGKEIGQTRVVPQEPVLGSRNQPIITQVGSDSITDYSLHDLEDDRGEANRSIIRCTVWITPLMDRRN